MTKIMNVAFDEFTGETLKDVEYGTAWPVVYIINNEKEAYIGETVNMSVRAKQHYTKDERKLLKDLNIISDDNFNKSVILDLENFLISHMSADGKFILQNGNMGMQQHNYYQQEEYEKTFAKVWKELKERNLTAKELYQIKNSDVFKYSPYKALNIEQYRIINKVIEKLVESRFDGKESTIVVNGEAGTGKTVVAVYLMKLLSEIDAGTDIDYEMDPGCIYVAENLSKLKDMKIGFVVPMQSLRETIKKVFKNIKGLKKSMVISPHEVPNDQYDLLVVDEAHRLRQRKALSQYPGFDNNNKKLGFDNSGTELDWILKCSKNQIFFYDSMQSIKPSDIDKECFDKLIGENKDNFLELKSQFRCAGGNDYINYVKNILDVKKPLTPMEFQNYEFRLYSNLEDMLEMIRKKNEEYELCRTVAGYSWKWISKKDKEAFDITIDGKEYRWNTENKDWVNSKNAINEIGCIHTVQGYDLNYVGVIFGNEIRYDEAAEKIYIDKSNYRDLQGKTALKSDQELKDYIVNIYKTLLTRGIKGAFVYACDKPLENYLKKYIKQ